MLARAGLALTCSSLGKAPLLHQTLSETEQGLQAIRQGQGHDILRAEALGRMPGTTWPLSTAGFGPQNNGKHFFFFWFWAIPGCAWGLLLTLYLGITPGRGLRGPYRVPGIKAGLDTCKASALPTVVSFQPI